MSQFHSTLWPLIEEASQGNTEALQEFVDKYRAPVIAFIRRAGYREEAEDIAQEVFLEIFKDRILERADPAKGRFRSLLLGITKHIISREKKRKHAKKRGSGRVQSLGDIEVPTPHEDEDFAQVWTEFLVQEGMNQLANSNPDYHDALRRFIFEGATYEEIVETTGKSHGWVKNSIHRGKLKLASTIRELICEYSSSSEEYEHEMRQFAQFYSI